MEHDDVFRVVSDVRYKMKMTAVDAQGSTDDYIELGCGLPPWLEGLSLVLNSNHFAVYNLNTILVQQFASPILA